MIYEFVSGSLVRTLDKIDMCRSFPTQCFINSLRRCHFSLKFFNFVHVFAIFFELVGDVGGVGIVIMLLLLLLLQQILQNLLLFFDDW